MPRYEFECDKCGFTDEYFYKVSQLPDSLECIECGAPMFRVYTCNFLLNGPDWPGKSLKLSHEHIVGLGMNDEFIDKADIAKKESEEILKQRRKGTKSWQEYQRHNAKKVERYKKNLRKGVKGKNGKK